MNTITEIADEIQSETLENPGLQLARAREKKGYTQEYVAAKLHLRVKMIELLEKDDYSQMPEAVFIRGYLRAYAKLLGISVEPLLAIFNSSYSSERKFEKALWQSKRESHVAERFVRWLTVLIAVGVIVAVGLWWQKNKESQPITTSKNDQIEKNFESETLPNSTESAANLTDISKMQSVLPSNNQLMPVETQGA